jgi:hypothetical protein
MDVQILDLEQPVAVPGRGEGRVFRCRSAWAICCPRVGMPAAGSVASLRRKLDAHCHRIGKAKPHVAASSGKCGSSAILIPPAGLSWLRR